MTAVALDAFPVFYDDDGNPLSGGKVFTYAAGTSTPLATFTDRSATVQNSNPIILDSAGRADIWLKPNEPYRIVVKNFDESEVIRDVDDFYAGADPAQLTIAGIVPSTGGTYTGAVSFTGGATFDGSAAQDLATLNSLNIAPVHNMDLWVNSDFAVNQRVATTAADGAVGFDRCIVLCESGSVTLAQLAQPADGIPYAMRMTQPDAGAKRIGGVQIAESKACIAYRGKQLVFAPKFRCSVATTVRVALVAWVGTADAPTKDVVNSWSSTNYTAGNFFVANTLPIAVGAVAVGAATWTDVPVSSASAGGVVVPSTLNNLYMVFWTDTQQAQNVTLDVSVVRCGLGTEIPIWTPPDPVAELQRCQRDYAKSYAIGTVPGTATVAGAVSMSSAVGGSIVGNFRFPVPMRAIPAGLNVWTTGGGPNQWAAYTSGGAVTAYAASLTATDTSLKVAISIAAGEIWAEGHWIAATGL